MSFRARDSRRCEDRGNGHRRGRLDDDAHAFDVDFVFISDTLLQFFLIYADEHGIWVRDQKQIIKHYVQSWFTIDLLAKAETKAWLKAIVHAGKEGEEGVLKEGNARVKLAWRSDGTDKDKEQKWLCSQSGSVLCQGGTINLV